VGRGLDGGFHAEECAAVGFEYRDVDAVVLEA
jgi:hypothetical protein